MMGKIRLFWKALAAFRKHNRYRNTGSLRCLEDAKSIAYKVGEMDAGNHVPVLFLGKPDLEREWASGKGDEFFFSWLVSRHRALHGTLRREDRAAALMEIASKGSKRA